jgi:hypothetical protein
MLTHRHGIPPPRPPLQGNPIQPHPPHLITTPLFPPNPQSPRLPPHQLHLHPNPHPPPPPQSLRPPPAILPPRTHKSRNHRLRLRPLRSRVSQILRSPIPLTARRQQAERELPMGRQPPLERSRRAALEAGQDGRDQESRRCSYQPDDDAVAGDGGCDAGVCYLRKHMGRWDLQPDSALSGSCVRLCRP